MQNEKAAFILSCLYACPFYVHLMTLLLEYTRLATPASSKVKPLCMLVKYLRLYTEVKNRDFSPLYQAARHKDAKLWSVILHALTR
jgi:hypothetical protein